jgi:hypothetical protein
MEKRNFKTLLVEQGLHFQTLMNLPGNEGKTMARNEKRTVRKPAIKFTKSGMSVISGMMKCGHDLWTIFGNAYIPPLVLTSDQRSPPAHSALR